MMISFAADAQFSSETVKKIDTIENNTAVDITLNPTNQVVIPYLNSGELVVDDGTGLQSFANGTEGQLLSITAGVLDFIDPPASSPLTTKGDIYVYDVDNQRLPVGTDGQLLSADSVETTGLKWIDPPVTTPTLVEGDLILRGATEDARLPIGLNEYLLTSDGTTASWQPAPVSTTLDTKGQIQGFSTENVAIPAPTKNGQFLVSDDTLDAGAGYTDSVTGLVSQAHFVGSLTYNTVSCGWSSTSTTFADFPANANCIPTNIIGEVAAPDTRIPAIKILNARTDGHYNVTLQGLIYSNGNGGCRFNISEDANLSDQGIVYTDGSSTFEGQVSATIKFSAGGEKTVRAISRFSPSTSSCQIFGSDTNPAKFTVTFMPDAGTLAAFQNSELTAATANELSAVIDATSGTPILVSSNYDWIDSITDQGAGNYIINYKAGIFTVAPSVVVSQELSGVTQVFAGSTSNVDIVTRSGTGGGADTKSRVKVSKQGIDVNKSQVIAGTFENIDSSDLVVVEAFSNGGQSITASVTPITFNETSDVQGVWDGDELTAPKNGIYTFAGAEQSTATSNRTIDVWLAPVSTGIYAFKKRCNQSASSTVQKFTCTVVMSTGDKAALRSDVSHTLQSAGSSHDLLITQSADYEAIVKNLYADNITECTKKYLSANIGVVTDIADLQFSLEVGKKYEVTSYFRYVPTGTDTGVLDSKDGSSVVCRNSVYSAAAQTPSPSVSCKFTATTSAMTHETISLSGGSSATGNGTNTQTHVELCKLPDTTIIN
jgi:hypothetical protein